MGLGLPCVLAHAEKTLIGNSLQHLCGEWRDIEAMEVRDYTHVALAMGSVSYALPTISGIAMALLLLLLFFLFGLLVVIVSLAGLARSEASFSSLTLLFL